MAKTCEHCKKSYPDDLDHCPHCAPAVEPVDENEAETFFLQHDLTAQEGHGKTPPAEAAEEAELDFAGQEGSGPPSGSSGVVLGLEPEDVAPASPAGPAPSDSAVDLVHPAEDLASAGAGAPGSAPGDSHQGRRDSGESRPLSDVYPADEVGPLSDVYPAEQRRPLSDVYPAEEAGPVSDVYPAEQREPLSDVYPAEGGPGSEAHRGPAGEGHAESSEDAVAEAWVVEEAEEGSAVHLDAAQPGAGSSSGLDFHPAAGEGKEGSAIDLGALDEAGSSTSAVNLSGAEEAGKEPSAIDLAGLEEGGSGASGSAIHLESAEEPAAPAGDLHFVPEALEPGGSEVYMRGSEPGGAAHAETVTYPGANLSGDEHAAEEDEEVTFGEEGPTSARDIVEEVESGVDLDRPREHAAAGAGSEHDSAVDLGGDAGHVLGAGSGSSAIPLAGAEAEHADDEEAATLLVGEEEHAGAESLAEAPEEAHEGDVVTVGAGDEEAGGEPSRGRPAGAARAGMVPWLGGGLIGAGAMAFLVAALWLLNLLPARQTARPVANPPTTGPAQPQAVASPPSLDLGQTQLHGGDFSKALDTFGQLEPANAQNPAFLTSRGEALWLKTLQQLHAEGKPVTRDELTKNPDVTKAKADLANAGTPDALFWLGMILDQTDGPEAARKTFEQAMAKFPDQKRRFQAAIDRLDLSAPDKAAGVRLSPAPGSGSELYWMSVALVALQAQPPAGAGAPAPPPAGAAAPGQPAPAGAAPSADDEAGYDFWTAVKLARENKYPEALAAIDKARGLHDRLRYTRLGRAQNPNSDPYEEIFLRACDELKVFWQVREKLAEAGYLDTSRRASPREVLAAVGKATKAEADVKAARKQVDQVAAALKDAGVKDDDPAKAVADLDTMRKKAEKQVSDVVAALKAAGVPATDPVKGVADLEGGKKKAEKRIDDVTAALKTAGVKAEDPVKGVADLEESKKAVQKELGEVAAALKTAGIAEADPVKGAEAAVAALGRSNGELDAVRTKLVDRKYLPAAATRADVPRGVDQLLQDAEHPVTAAVARVVDDVSGAGARLTDRVGKVLNAEGELAACRLNAVRMEAQLADRWTPEQMLDVWLTALQDHPSPVLTDEALKDAQRVLNEKPMPAAVCVRALAERSKGDFARARADLQGLTKTPAPPESRWFQVAQTNLRQLSDPSASYLPRVRELRAARKYPEALATLDQALLVFSEDAFPADHANLLALRSEVRLDQARSGGAGERPPAEALKASDQDAKAAVAGGDKVEGNYALGRVAEMQGELPKAEALYRQALEAYDAAAKNAAGFARSHPASDRLGNRYREALSRVLLEEVRQAKAPPPKEAAPPAGAKTTRLDPDQVLTVVRPVCSGGCVQFAAVCLALLQPGGGAVAPEGPPDDRLQEALRLADQMIAAGDYRGYLLKGEALGRTHRWADALQATEEGVKKALPPQEAAPLTYVLENHPAFQRREGIKPPDPVIAEEHYETGLPLYFDGRYAEAERNFADAVYYNDQDARYLYFLGLARLAQPGKRDVALDDFRQAGRLEAQNRPSSAAVSTALERVQGPARRILNAVRERAIEAATAKAP